MTYVKLGSTGPDVVRLQTDLNTLDAAGLTIDGSFGPRTLAAVRVFQSAQGIVVDGVVGPQTQATILNALAGVVVPPVDDGSEKNPASIDLYHSDNVVSFAQIAASKIRMVCHKGTDGTTSLDSMIQTRWPQIKDNGMMAQAYLFYRPGQNPQTQADNFLRYVMKFWNNDKPHVLDFGEFDIPASAALSNAGLLILKALTAETGKPAWTYGARGLLAQYKLPAEYAQYPAWLADPSHNPPIIPSPWPTFIAEQYVLDSGRVPGIGNGCDLDYFNGTLDQLRAL